MGPEGPDAQFGGLPSGPGAHLHDARAFRGHRPSGKERLMGPGSLGGGGVLGPPGLPEADSPLLPHSRAPSSRALGSLSSAGFPQVCLVCIQLGRQEGAWGPLHALWRP